MQLILLMSFFHHSYLLESYFRWSMSIEYLFPLFMHVLFYLLNCPSCNVYTPHNWYCFKNDIVSSGRMFIFVVIFCTLCILYIKILASILLLLIVLDKIINILFSVLILVNSSLSIVFIIQMFSSYFWRK